MANKSNVLAVAGYIFRAPVGTTLPTSASGELDAAFKNAGYIGESGLTLGINRSFNKVRDWFKSVVKVIRTEHDVQFSWEYLEFDAEACKAFFGEDNVTGSGSTLTVRINDAAIEDSAYVIDMHDGDNVIRAVIPCGAFAAEGGELNFNLDDVIRIPMQVEALKDDTSGDNAILYRGVKAA